MVRLLWLFLLAYVFGAGYVIALGIDRFSRARPGAAPQRHNTLILLPPNWGDDGTCKLWYNEITNFEELESHEANHT